MKKLNWEEYRKLAREIAAEGCVLLKNENHVLPLQEGRRVSVFGRIQTNYYKSGTGSGGMVNVSETVGIVNGLRQSGVVQVNEKLVSIYEYWEKTHPFDSGLGWGQEPWSQEEMPLDDEVVSAAAAESDYAIVIIGRTAGEDKDAGCTSGSWLLTDLEEEMLRKVRASFDRMIVLLNVGSIIDMQFVKRYEPDAVLYVWQGGMVGGHGVADVLTGAVSPSGKLADTIACSIHDYPSDRNFGDENRTIYEEDIYVGYRYFETFAPEKVLFPFGFGRSYTDFSVTVLSAGEEAETIYVAVEVKNIGAYSGKEVVQIYAGLPQGVLGKPSRTLIAFQKTACLAPDEVETLKFEVKKDVLSSYDDSGETGFPSAYVLEKGDYVIYVGTDAKTMEKAYEFSIRKTRLVQQLLPVLPCKKSFSRLYPRENPHGGYQETFAVVPAGKDRVSERRLENLQHEIPYQGDRGIKLVDVLSEKNTMDEFLSQLSDEDLACIIRGEGMGSPRVTPGTASAFGGVSDALTGYGIPAGCCDDGPSGLRLDCGKKAFSLPGGTLIACTFNEKLTEELFSMTALEMNFHHVDCLLGPGMNIHRHPLCGRNFEYFSEDPMLTGKMAAAELRGLHRYGVTGVLKHFCCNNQEYRRFFQDSVVSERALREIYLKGFEIAVKEGNADAIMTTYGSLNGTWTGASYDLLTTLLREEWGFSGIVMTDWFDTINDSATPSDKNDFAAMAAAQNDLYMVCPDSSINSVGDNTLASLENGRLKRCELQRNAKNICGFLMKSQAMKRLMNTFEAVEIVGMPRDEEMIDTENIVYEKVGNKFSFSLTEKPSVKGTNYLFAADIGTKGLYRVSLTGSSDLGRLAQTPCTLFAGGVPVLSFAFFGTEGEEKTLSKELFINTKYSLFRFFVGQNGVNLNEISFELIKHLKDIPIEERPKF